jgi:MarR family transcriptional regulator, 2-MHQ and catechol-resistance regulon repressor
MPSRYRGTPDQIRTLDAFIKLMRAAGAVRGRLGEDLAGRGLTENQFGVLEMLLHLGPRHQQEISRKLFTTGANISLIVEQLVRRGLVERRRDADDRRRVSVRLTAQGRRLIQTVFPRHLKSVMAEFATLSPAEQESLAILCRKLGRAEPPDRTDTGRGAES